MKKVFLWGAGKGYDSLLNIIKYEELKKNIDVLGIISRDEICKIIDQYEVVPKERLISADKDVFDYIIVLAPSYFKEILNEALDMGISRNKIIDGQVMTVPCFDFTYYFSLVENPVSIISNNCWGGFIYNKLCLPFCSPFINATILKNDFFKIISDLKWYLSQELRKEKEGDLFNNPIGALGHGEKKALIYFVHSYSFDEAKKDFDRRRQKINLNNIFIHFVDRGKDSLEIGNDKLMELPYKKIFMSPEASEGWNTLLNFQKETINEQI